MKIKTAIEILKKYNQWRRGADIEQEKPWIIGKAIDVVVKYVENVVEK